MQIKCFETDFKDEIDLLIKSTQKISDILLPDFNFRLSDEEIAIIRLIMSCNDNQAFFKYLSKIDENDFKLKVLKICKKLFAKNNLELMQAVYRFEILSESYCTSAAKALLRKNLPKDYRVPIILYPNEIKILKLIKNNNFIEADTLIKKYNKKFSIKTFKEFIYKKLEFNGHITGLINYLTEIGII